MLTRSLNVHNVFMAIGLLTALGMFSLAEPVDAALLRAGKREPQKVSNEQLREALRVLQGTKQTLEGADHDYGGHRVVAIKAIGAAQHHLKLALATQGKHTKPAAPSTGKAAKPGLGNEAQSISNMQLAVAIPILHNTRLLLEKADHDYGGHRAAAVRELGAAVQHLKAALKFEKK